MVKLKNNYHQCSSTRIRNVTTLLTSSSFKRWIILLFLLYKLDYKDYYCYGISSVSSGNSEASNNENGKNLSLTFFCSFILFFLPNNFIHVHPTVLLIRVGRRKSICGCLGCNHLDLIGKITNFVAFKIQRSTSFLTTTKYLSKSHDKNPYINTYLLKVNLLSRHPFISYSIS